ncbi:unnamed protein product, partial [Scytosiphon promiscuus]
VFFRLLKSLQQRKNTQGVLKLIKQVPCMMSNTPSLSLSPPGRVVDEIMSAAEGLLCDAEHNLSTAQERDVLEAMVGLAVKRGSLAHCLRVLKLLF